MLDEIQGPLILELIAQPGLNIQIANRIGLLIRLPLVEQELQGLNGLEARLNFAKQHFSAGTDKSQ